MSLANPSATRLIDGSARPIGRLGEKERVVPRAGRRNKAFSFVARMARLV